MTTATQSPPLPTPQQQVRTAHQWYLTSVHELHVFFLAPTGAPGGFTSTTVESRSLNVLWGTVPDPHQRGLITGYRLCYSNGTCIVNTTGEGSRQHVLNGLTPFTSYTSQAWPDYSANANSQATPDYSYTVQVAAVNDGGTGPYCDPALTVETLQDGERGY